MIKPKTISGILPRLVNQKMLERKHLLLEIEQIFFKKKIF